MQMTTAKNHVVKLLALALLANATCVPFVHAGQDRFGQLYNAINYENVPEAKAALAASIDWANDGRTDHHWDKNTPLMCAVVAKHKEVEKFLRQHGARE